MVTNINEFKKEKSKEEMINMFEAAFDKGYMDECFKLGNKLKLDNAKIYWYISEVSLIKRDKMNISIEDDKQAKRALEIAKGLDEPVTIVKLPHDKWFAIIDRIYDPYNSLVIETPERNYIFGNRSSIKKVFNNLGGEIQQMFGLEYWVGNSEVTEIQKVLK